ncbi:probable LRR receptor-like serine/threonine-protein kinase [Tanacetum coccineum]
MVASDAGLPRSCKTGSFPLPIVFRTVDVGWLGADCSGLLMGLPSRLPLTCESVLEKPFVRLAASGQSPVCPGLSSGPLRLLFVILGLCPCMAYVVQAQRPVLFLGNNSLNGTLPDVKSASLNNIDLSYNELSGTLPSWVNMPFLQINLVVNNFTLEGSENIGIPTGLNCLQRNFPCGLGSPRSLHSQTNLPALDYDFSKSPFVSSADGSLRYYGLGLENGNYTVNLQFAELQIEDTPT